MRVLIFSTAYFPLVGGAEIAVRELTDRMPDHEFDLLTARFQGDLPKEEEVGHVRVRRLGFGTPLDKWLLPWTAARKAESLHRERPYDAIWVIMASYAAFGAERFKRKHEDIPMLLTLQEGDPPELIARKTRFVKGWFRNIFRRADAVQAISHFLLDWGKSQGFEGPAEVIPNGVDLDRFAVRLDEDERQRIRDAHGFGADDHIIVTASRLVEKNGVDLLIDALPELPDRTRLLIAGTGPLEAELKDRAETLGVGGRVVFAGLVEHAHLPELLAASDVFCRPSRSEGMGNAFVEAMAAGLPTIGTRVGGIPDVIEDGENGLLIEPESSKAVAEAVRRLIDDRELAARLAEEGKRTAHERFGWDRLAEKIQALFARMTAKT